MPGRFKRFHMYKCGVIIDTVIAFFKPFVPKKMMERVSEIIMIYRILCVFFTLLV